MLFNSYEYIFLFLPLTLAIFFLLGRRGSRKAAVDFLVLASLVFYGRWNPPFLALIVSSVVVNYAIARAISRHHGTPRSRSFLALGVAFDLGLLGWFKYAGFLVESLNWAAGLAVPVPHPTLPLAISFFTFQQIAFLVDTLEEPLADLPMAQYGLFVTFFPQLIAGPIIHHKEILPQFEKAETFVPRLENVAVGLTIFVIGLFKKTVLADGIMVHVAPGFDAAARGHELGFLAAWAATLCYGMQIYFDFSGYSDMAIGGARLFGIVLPLNFHSPYKATSIIEFWRRWHVTLSRFLRDYLYIPLGGNRHGRWARHRNLLVTMLLGGLWHGAGWTFVVWGGLHGAALMVNHGWHALSGSTSESRRRSGPVARLAAGILTFLVVHVCWVFFRAPTMAAATSMLAAMARPTWPTGALLAAPEWRWIAVLVVVATCFPNTQEMLFEHQPAHPESLRDLHVRPASWLRWQPDARWALAMGLAGTVAILHLTAHSEFLYFRF